MEITQVKVFPVREDKLKAFVSVVFDHCFMVNDIKVIQGKDGLFLSMPSRRKRNGEFKDVAHPLNNDTRRLLEESVLREYRTVVDDETPRRPDRDSSPEEEGEGAEVDSERSAADGNGSRPSSGDQEAEGAPSPPPPTSDVADPPPVRASGNGSPPPDADESTSDPAMGGNGRPSLEEVQKEHLSDSFWSVT